MRERERESIDAFTKRNCDFVRKSSLFNGQERKSTNMQGFSGVQFHSALRVLITKLEIEKLSREIKVGGIITGKKAEKRKNPSLINLP